MLTGVNCQPLRPRATQSPLLMEERLVPPNAGHVVCGGREGKRRGSLVLLGVHGRQPPALQWGSGSQRRRDSCAPNSDFEAADT